MAVVHTNVRPAKNVVRVSSTAFLSVIAIVFGTFIATFSVPENVYPPDALFWPALYMSVALLVLPVLRFRQHPSDALRIENFIMIGLIYWLMLDMLQVAYPFKDTTAASVRFAFVEVGVFAAVVVIGASGRGWRLPRMIVRAAAQDYSSEAIFAAATVAFVLGMSKYVIGSGFDPILLIEGLGMPRWSAPWSRGQFGGAGAFLDHMSYFGFVVPPLCVLLAVRVGWLNSRVLILIFLSTIIVVFVAQSGGRRTIGVILGAALITWVSAKPKISAKLVIGGAAAAVAVLAGLQEMLRYRNVGFVSWWQGERPELHVSHLHVDDNFLRLSQLIGFYPDQISYVYHGPLFHALTLPIPRVFWPGKPLGPGFDLPALLGKEGVALTSSIIGELHVSLGIVAVVAGAWVVGRLAGMWNKVLLLPSGVSRPLVFGLGVMVIFAGLRSVQAFVQMSYIVLAWLVISGMITEKKRLGKSMR